MSILQVAAGASGSVNLNYVPQFLALSSIADADIESINVTSSDNQTLLNLTSGDQIRAVANLLHVGVDTGAFSLKLAHGKRTSEDIQITIKATAAGAGITLDAYSLRGHRPGAGILTTNIVPVLASQTKYFQDCFFVAFPSMPTDATCHIQAADGTSSSFSQLSMRAAGTQYSDVGNTPIVHMWNPDRAQQIRQISVTNGTTKFDAVVMRNK